MKTSVLGRVILVLADNWNVNVCVDAETQTKLRCATFSVHNLAVRGQVAQWYSGGLVD